MSELTQQFCWMDSSVNVDKGFSNSLDLPFDFDCVVSNNREEYLAFSFTYFVHSTIHCAALFLFHHLFHPYNHSFSYRCSISCFSYRAIFNSSTCIRDILL